jgi:heat shock protein HtpX
MPFTHLEIEQRKSIIIILLFIILIVIYFMGTWFAAAVAGIGLLFLCPQYISGYGFMPSLSGNLWILGIALISGAVHWLISTANIIPRISALLGAMPLDDKDRYHQRFKNIVEEVSIAIGGRRIECMVIPTTAVNSFSVADFHGNSLIGVTEGLLARLSRHQIEAIVAHEAGHIVSGDCLITTVSCSLFGIYAAAFRYITVSIENSIENTAVFDEDRERDNRNNDAFIALYLLFIGCVVGVTAFFSMIINTLISRQKEYRADALSVKLTRNPLALAEALHIVSGSWCGAGHGIENLGSIFIANPAYEEADEGEGFVPDLISTHPPMSKRIKVLLDMAHADIRTLDNPQQADPTIASAEQLPAEPAPKWFVSKENTWTGPFDMDHLAALPGFGPDTWIKAEGEDRIKPAGREPSIAAWFNKGNLVPFKCPHCELALMKSEYEGTSVYRCSHAHGLFVKKSDLMKIIIRRDTAFSPNILKLADIMAGNSEQARAMAMSSKQIKSSISCPQCGITMNRRCYSIAYPVLVDICKTCNVLWFDQYEMELLQALVEKTAPNLA